MKNIKYLLASICVSGCLYGCTDAWDSHYSQQKETLDNDKISVAATSAIDYLKSTSDLSSMYSLFEETGSIEAMEKKEQPYTILVANNSAISAQGSDATDDKKYLATSHISDIALSPISLTNGQRVLMWNGKYLTVTREALPDGSSSILFNDTKVTKIIKVNNGFIYELESYVAAPKSMYELIKSLSSNYSVFKNMILSRNKKAFDKDASIPIGVDNTGSTVYDSIFVITNPYFAAQGFDIMSESLTATMLIPSNEVVNTAINTAKANLKAWNMTRADSIIENWIFQSVFFKEEYTKQDFSENEDLTSIFHKQWRTTVQQVNTDHPIKMSNGTAYYVTWMKIPTNVLIYRIKDYFKWYEYLSEEDKDKYFKTENLLFEKCETRVKAWSGWPAGGFPEIENRIVRFKLEDTEKPEFTLDFTPFQYKDNGDGTYLATPYLIPPGEYDLCLGFEQKLGHDVEVSFDGEFIKTITTSELTSTNYHYDRGGQGYPEGYDLKKATHKKKNNYDRDGQKIGEVTISGTEPSPISIKFKGINVTKGSTRFHHWCLKPSKNCY